MTETSNNGDIQLTAINAHLEYQRREKEWLASLKVGAEVAISVGHSRRFEIVKIARETPKFWVVGSWKYRKDDGHGVGGSRWSGPGWLRMPNDEIREENERHTMIQTLESAQWRKAPTWALRAVTRALKTEKPVTDNIPDVAQDAPHGHKGSN